MNYSIILPDTASNEAPVQGGAGISVEDALGNGILQQATLLAGKAGCARVVLSVLPVEVPDTSQWLKGGELVLTTGYVLRDAVEPWLAFLKDLVTANAAGLVVLASPYIKMIPDQAIEYAEQQRFPLLVMATAGPIVDVVRPLQEAIEASRSGSVREGLSLQRRLMQMVLDGTGLEAVAKFLGRHLNQTLLIEDKQFNLLAYAQAGSATDPALDELIANKGTPVTLMKKWEEDGTLKALRKDKLPVTIPSEKAGHPSRTIYPVVVSGEVFGFFSVLTTAAMTDHDRLIIDNGITAIAIELLKQKGATESEQKMKRDFFRDLLIANTAAMTETLRRRATYLGTPLTSQYWVINVEFDDVKNDDILPDDINRLVGILNSLLSFRQAVVVNQAQGASILYPVKEGQPTLDKIRHLAKAIHQKVTSASPTWSVSIGVGQQYPDLMSVPKAYKEAQHALKIGRSTNGPGAITFFAELGIYRMLLQFAQSQDPNEFFCEPLQRLIEYNQQTDKELVKTIAAFLECNGNLTETSNKLFIHRNTLKYRLERIRDITQIDLDDSENRLMLHLGLKMNQVINYLT
ncbi:MAG: sugar diacid utilization regulator [Cyanobacteria bacterium RYN_339]|nr:sugar diacid utilization regulator [Cyanobacteria bacterium RYN_339]